jgi:hypothetical protein
MAIWSPNALFDMLEAFGDSNFSVAFRRPERYDSRRKAPFYNPFSEPRNTIETTDRSCKMQAHRTRWIAAVIYLFFR